MEVAYTCADAENSWSGFSSSWNIGVGAGFFFFVIFVGTRGGSSLILSIGIFENL